MCLLLLSEKLCVAFVRVSHLAAIHLAVFLRYRRDLFPKALVPSQLTHVQKVGQTDDTVSFQRAHGQRQRTEFASELEDCSWTCC